MVTASISNPVCLWLSRDLSWETASCYLTWNRFDPFCTAYLSFSDSQYPKEICQQTGDYALLLITNLPNISLVWQSKSHPLPPFFHFEYLFWSSFNLIVLVLSTSCSAGLRDYLVQMKSDLAGKIRTWSNFTSLFYWCWANRLIIITTIIVAIQICSSESENVRVAHFIRFGDHHLSKHHEADHQGK